MKTFSLLFLLTFGTLGFSQSNDTIGEAARRLQQRDSAIEFYQRKKDSLDKVDRINDSLRLAQEFRSNTDYFLRLQKENRAKQKKAALTRIAIGVAGFAILIIGLMRRRKKANKQ